MFGTINSKQDTQSNKCPKLKNNPKFRIVQNLNNTEKIMNDTFWVGICPLINEEDINKIILSIGSFISQII